MDWITLFIGIVFGFIAGLFFGTLTSNRRLHHANQIFADRVVQLERKLDAELNLVNEDIKKIGHKLCKMENVE